MNRLSTEKVSVRHLSKGSYVIEEASISVEAGTCVALLGPNGAGKSTLLRAIAGLSSGFVTGRVLINGDNIGQLSARQLAHLRSFVPQDNPMPFAFSVREAVSLGTTSPVSPEMLNVALARFDLERFADRSVLALSGGERQRVAIARAFLQQSPILLLDEPTAHQDLRYAGKVLAEIRRYVDEKPQERIAVVVLHDLNLARDWADQILVLKNGSIVAAGPPGNVLTTTILSGVYETSISVTPFIHANL